MTLPLLRRLHKWVAIVVAAQVVLWALGGTVFAWLDHHAVAGEDLTRPLARPTLAESGGADRPLADPLGWLAPYARQDVREVRLERLLDRWVYRVETVGGVVLHDAQDGSPVTIDAPTARAIAAARYAGGGAMLDVVMHEAATLETREHGAAWAVRYDDEAGTTLWLAADDGRLLEVRTDAWRLFDVFWMLHTMDYAGRDDFNNPVVILAGTAALWVALTGLLMAARLLRRNDRASRASGLDRPARLG